MTNPYLGIQKQSLQCLFREMGTHCFSCFTTNMDASVEIWKEKQFLFNRNRSEISINGVHISGRFQREMRNLN